MSQLKGAKVNDGGKLNRLRQLNMINSSTAVVDNFRELGNVYGSDGNEQELDDVCAKKTKSGGIVTSKPMASIQQD